MMRMTVLASGSYGNSTLVSSSRTRILVDAGLSCRELLKRLHIANEEAAGIDALLISHEHQDHVQGLSVLARKLGIPVYFTQATHRAWMRWITPRPHVTYAQWVEQCRQQAATRQAEALAAAIECECDEAEAVSVAGPLVAREQSGAAEQNIAAEARSDPARLPS